MRLAMEIETAILLGLIVAGMADGCIERNGNVPYV